VEFPIYYVCAVFGNDVSGVESVLQILFPQQGTEETGDQHLVEYESPLQALVLLIHALARLSTERGYEWNGLVLGCQIEQSHTDEFSLWLGL